MTKREIAFLACRILSVYLVAFALINLPLMFSIGKTTPPGTLASLFVWGPLILEVVLGIGLWRFAGRLASAMVPDDTVPIRITAKAQEFLIIGFALIGLILLSKGIPNICSLLVRLFAEANLQGLTLGEVFRSRILPSQNYQIGAAVAQTVIGLGLLLYPRELTEFLTSRRAPRGIDTSRIEG